MDDLLIKANNTVRDGTAPKSTAGDNLSALAGLAVSFNDMLHKAGLRIESGFYALAGLGAITERSEPANPTDDYRRQPDDGKDRADVRDRSDANRDEPARARQAERPNDSGRDAGAERRDARDDARGDARDGDYAGDRADGRAADKGDDGAANRDAPAANDRNGKSESASKDDDAGNAPAKSGNSDGEANAANQQPGGEQAAGQVAIVNAANAKATVTTNALNPLLAGLLPTGQAMAETAVQNIAKATPVGNGADGAQRDNTRAKTQVSFGAETQAKMTTSAESVHTAAGSGKAAAAPVEAKPEAVAKMVDDIQTQAKPLETQVASLARMLGADNRAQVNVNVDDEARTLMSRPTATLTAGAALATDTQGRSGSGQSANAHVQAGIPNQASANQAQQSQSGPAQAQGGSNAQAQSAAQAGGDAKGLMQATSASGNAGGTAHASGGEAGTLANNANNAQGTQQTQQAQQQAAAGQAKQAEQPVRGGHSVFEQVFVKINKAVNAGNDKITIQLRPANMGRVEVKMELTHDNRLMAVLTADNKQTLELLQRDARDLQRALADAGLHTGSGDLQFNLRGETGQGTDGDGKSPGKLIAPDEVADAGDTALQNTMFPPEGGIYANGRIDIRA